MLQEAHTLDKDGHLLQRRKLPGVNPVWNIQRQLLIRALLDRATELGARVHTSCAVEQVGPEGAIGIGDPDNRA